MLAWVRSSLCKKKKTHTHTKKQNKKNKKTLTQNFANADSDTITVVDAPVLATFLYRRAKIDINIFVQNISIKRRTNDKRHI